MTKRDSEIIYVALLDEGVDVWRPVEAQRLPSGDYLILEQYYDRRPRLGSSSWAPP